MLADRVGYLGTIHRLTVIYKCDFEETSRRLTRIACQTVETSDPQDDGQTDLWLSRKPSEARPMGNGKCGEITWHVRLT